MPNARVSLSVLDSESSALEISAHAPKQNATSSVSRMSFTFLLSSYENPSTWQTWCHRSIRPGHDAFQSMARIHSEGVYCYQPFFADQGPKVTIPGPSASNVKETTSTVTVTLAPSSSSPVRLPNTTPSSRKISHGLIETQMVCLPVYCASFAGSLHAFFVHTTYPTY